MSLSKWLPCVFLTMINCNPPIAHCHPLLCGGGILVDHWSAISSYHSYWWPGEIRSQGISSNGIGWLCLEYSRLCMVKFIITFLPYLLFMWIFTGFVCGFRCQNCFDRGFEAKYHFLSILCKMFTMDWLYRKKVSPAVPNCRSSDIKSDYCCHGNEHNPPPRPPGNPRRSP